MTTEPRGVPGTGNGSRLQSLQAGSSPDGATRRNAEGALSGTDPAVASHAHWNGTGQEGGRPGQRPVPQANAPSRTWATSLEYHFRYQRLRERAALAGAGPEDHVGFARWLIASKAEAQPAYWRKLKAAALFGLDMEGAASARPAEALLRAEGSDGTARGAPRRTPRRKAITADELQRLLEKLTWRAQTSEVARVTILWLVAGYATGLRPCEWRSAVLTEDEHARPVLQVVNAKHTNGRANGATRTLALSGLRRQEREAVTLLLRAVAERPGEFARLHRASADLLRAVNRELWPRRRGLTGLYSARHQFAADAKRVLDRTEVAALMGHRTTRTAGLHYASRRHGRARPGLPRAQPDEVARVVTHRHSGPPIAAPAPTSAAVAPDGPDADRIT